jgi:hypothetical protein
MHDLGVMEAERAVCIRIQEIGLHLQFVRGRPEVVSVEDGNKLAPRFPYAPGHDRIAPEVFLRQDQPDPLRVTLLVIHHDVPGTVSGAVLADQDLVRKAGLLP